MSEFEKYGVLEDPEKVKTAQEDPTKRICPECGAELVPGDKVNVYICPRCGTKPFEQ